MENTVSGKFGQWLSHFWMERAPDLEIIDINSMEPERAATNQQVYKNPNWAERKKELKATRSQRTTKNIKNIKAIDTPCDPNFNCTQLLIKTPPSRPRPPTAIRPSTAISPDTKYPCPHPDPLQRQRHWSLLLRQDRQKLHQNAQQARLRPVPHASRRNPHRQSCMTDPTFNQFDFNAR
jgi:hypothetical protein